MSYYGPLPPVSNRESWNFEFDLPAVDTNIPIDLTGYSIEASVEDQQCCERLRFTSASGRISIASTVASFTATPTEMSGLRPGRYKFFLKITKDGFTTQICDGGTELTIIEGGPK